MVSERAIGAESTMSRERCSRCASPAVVVFEDERGNEITRLCREHLPSGWLYRLYCLYHFHGPPR